MDWEYRSEDEFWGDTPAGLESDEADPDDELAPEEEPDPEVVEEKIPFSLWSHRVAAHLEAMTDFAETIETVGYFDWWEEFWREGLSPDEAAKRGLIRDLLLEDE